MKTILFTGDSITDALRSREDRQNRGIGYPTLIAGSMGYDRPGQFDFVNTGISGNRVTDLIARVKCDIINRVPDYISILIGVNDVWHELAEKNGVSAQRYALYYKLLLEQIREALPQVKLLVLEPFVLKGTATEANWELFRTEVALRAAAARQVAQEAGACFVPLQERFDKATETAPESYWLYDGVHPSAMGHELIKRAWMEAFAALEQDK